MALLSTAMALPVGATICKPAKPHCPGMSAAMRALCAQVGAATPDCCHKQQPAQSVPARNSSHEAPVAASPDAVAATLPAASVAGLLATSTGPRVFSRDAALHELGLFTLFATFRI